MAASVPEGREGWHVGDAGLTPKGLQARGGSLVCTPQAVTRAQE